MMILIMANPHHEALERAHQEAQKRAEEQRRRSQEAEKNKPEIEKRKDTIFAILILIALAALAVWFFYFRNK